MFSSDLTCVSLTFADWLVWRTDVLIGPQIEAVQGFPALVQAHCINRSLFKFDEYKFLFIYF